MVGSLDESADYAPHNYHVTLGHVQVASCMISMLYFLDWSWSMYFCQNAHIEAWQGLLIWVKQTPRNLERHPREANIECKKRENLCLNKNLFHPLFFISSIFDWDFVNHFLIHKHRPCEWEKAYGNLRSHIQFQSLLVVFPLVLQWRSPMS